METPAEVLIHNVAASMKGTAGTLLRVSSDGYYEVNSLFGANTHRLLLPIHQTVLISKTPEEVFEPHTDVER